MRRTTPWEIRSLAQPYTVCHSPSPARAEGFETLLFSVLGAVLSIHKNATLSSSHAGIVLHELRGGDKTRLTACLPCCRQLHGKL